MPDSPTLGDLTTFITSKNAGPFLVTIDAVFRSTVDYERVRDSGALTPTVVAALYGRPAADVVAITFFDPARALKVTLRRPVPAGHVGDTDVYGAQQHVPLMGWSLPSGGGRPGAAVEREPATASGGASGRG